MSNASWLKSGEESKKLAEGYEEEREQLDKQYALPFRFFIGKGETTQITFIDGDLDEDGVLTPPRWYEHSLQVAGKMTHYICPVKTNPEGGGVCPLCESGDRATLVAAFTIIDHTTGKSRDGKTEYKDRVKLMIVKPIVFDLLAYNAKRNGGLSCTRFEVARLGDKASAQGDVYTVLEKLPRQKLRNRYWREIQVDNGSGEMVPKKVTNFEPVNYGDDIPFYTCEQLASMGLGRAVAVGGNQSFKQQNGGTVNNDNYVPPSMREEAASGPDGVDYETQL